MMQMRRSTLLVSNQQFIIRLRGKFSHFYSSSTVVYAEEKKSATVGNSSSRKVVIIGGVAGGATAAARAMRLNNKLDITVIERSPDVSFANCGLPYYIGGEITDRSKLALQTPESLSSTLGIKVLTNTDAFKIDRSTKTVSIRSSTKSEGITTGATTLPYDTLILSPGASPLKPPVEGINDPRVLTLRNLQDMDKINAIVKQASVKRVAVIGAGFIGLEMVEQLHRIAKKVYLIEKAPAVLPQADDDMAEFLHGPLIEKGVNLIVGDGLLKFDTSAGPKSPMKVLLESGKHVDVDLVILSIGVRPESQLAKDAQLELNPRGYITVNEFMQTKDPSIYAVGDVIETPDLVFPDRKATVALGNIANMQARIAADHIVLGKSIPYKGSLGTSIVRAFDTVLALTGWNEKRLKAAGIPYATTTITDNSHASYYPGALPITMKITYDPSSGRVFGGQAVGVDGVDKRIDAIAMAITGRLTVDDLSQSQLCYSPPFGSARDVVNIAGLAARNIKEGLIKPAYSLSAPSITSGKEVKLVDVRPFEVSSLHPLPNSINIPYKEITKKAKDLDPSYEYRTVCNLGKTSYFASRNLLQAGLTSSTLVGGLKMHDKPKPEAPVAEHEGAVDSKSVSPAGESVRITLDCSGMACPGPLMKMKAAVAELPPGAILQVLATDPGFKSDVKAFASSNGLQVTSLSTNKGVIHADLTRRTGVAAASNAMLATNSRKGATIVVFSQEYDKVLGAFVIANGAAAMGGNVTMFFTFWGLNAIRDSTKRSIKQKNLIDSTIEYMMPKGGNKLPISNFNFGGLGPTLLRQEMRRKDLPNLENLMKSAKKNNVRLVACTMSMEAMGITAEELTDGVELGGVADYLGAAEKAGTNLFI